MFIQRLWLRFSLNSNIFILPQKPAKFHYVKTKKKPILKISENDQIEAVGYKLLNVLYDQWVRGYRQEFEFEAH